MMVWQAHERNEWSVAIEHALAGDEESLPAAPHGSDPFSLADPEVVNRTLGAAGFIDVTFADVREPVYYGLDVGTALEWVGGFACTKEWLKRLHPSTAEKTLERLRETLAAHAGAGGIWFDARAWIVGARRGPSGSGPQRDVSA